MSDDQTYLNAQFCSVVSPVMLKLNFLTLKSQALEQLKEERDIAARQTRLLQQELVIVLHVSLHYYITSFWFEILFGVVVSNVFSVTKLESDEKY